MFFTPIMFNCLFKYMKYAIIVCVNLVCYYQSIEGEFVFDDSVAIVKNRDVNNGEINSETLKNIFLRSDFWGNNLTSKDSHKSFRPLITLSFALHHHYEGFLSPDSMRAVNLAIHIINCCLLLNFYKVIMNNKTSGFIASLLFSVHPVHTEAVCGIVSRSDLIGCLIFLIAGTVYFSNFLKDSNTFKVHHAGAITVIVILSFLGVLSKENSITIMPSLIIIDFIRNTKRLKILPNLSTILRMLILILCTISILVFRLWMQNFEAPAFRKEDNKIAACDDWYSRIVTQNYLYCLNFFLLLAPDRLSFDWSFDSITLIKDLKDLRIIFIVIFYGFMLSAVFIGLRRRKILIALSLIVIPFLPGSGIVKVGFVIAERILYVPSIGFCMLVAIGLSDLLKKFPSQRRFIIVAFSIMLTFHSLKTYKRSLEWTSERKLFYSALKVVPGNAKVYYNIARISSEVKEIETAMNFYKKAIQLYPNYESAHMNLGNLYREKHQYEKAKFHLRKSVEILEEFPTAWMNLGIVYSVVKDYEASEKCYKKALSYRSNYANAFYNLGNLYIETKNFTSAVESWKRACSINPKHVKAWSNILAFFDNQNNHEQVLRYSEMALSFLPNNPSILFSRANAFGKNGEFEKAEKIFKQIIQIEQKPIYFANLGVLYHRWNKKELAKKFYELALELDSTLKNARTNLIKLNIST